jgi:hypothetical protein
VSCICNRKPVLARIDRGGVLRCVWLRAPPLLSANLTRAYREALTRGSPYEGRPDAQPIQPDDVCVIDADTIRGQHTKPDVHLAGFRTV